jgi:tight adherence protein B
MRTVVAAVIGASAVARCRVVARRLAVVDRLPPAHSRRWLPAVIEQRIVGALDAAALDIPPATALQYWAVALTIGVVLGLALAGVNAAFALAAAVVAGGPLGLHMLRGRRARLAAAAVPASIERVASELRAGGTITTAITGMARGDGALASDFALIDARVRLGSPIADALRAWSTERSAQGIDVAAGALAMCAAVGGRSADALEGVASSLRDRRAVAAEARALSAQGRLSAIVVGGMPFVYVAWSALVDRHALHALTGTSTGHACLLVGTLLEGLGAIWMRRILRAGSLL